MDEAQESTTPDNSINTQPPVENSSNENTEKTKPDNRTQIAESTQRFFRDRSSVVQSIVESVDLIPKVDASNKSVLGTAFTTGEVEGYKFSVRYPHLRHGEGATIGLVSVEGSDGKFSFVLKSGKFSSQENFEAEQQEEILSKHPEAAEFLPHLYGRFGRWAAIETLQGIELEELTDRLKTDPDFQELYVNKAFELLSSAALKQLVLQDVAFINGHNVIVNPDTAEIRLIELASVGLSSHYPDEIITMYLLQSFMTIGYGHAEPYQIDMSMKMIKLAIDKLGRDRLFVQARNRMISPERFQKEYPIHYGEKMPDSLYQYYKANPDKCSIPELGYEISPELLDAVDNNDIEAFRSVFRSHAMRKQILDPNDHRAHRVTIPIAE